MRYPFPAGLLATAFLVAVPSDAQEHGGPVRVEPNSAGKASHQILDLRPSDDPQANGESPQQAFIDIAAGFKFDSRARKETCSTKQAQEFDCPDDSKVGSGTAQGALISSAGVFPPIPLDITLDIFLGPPQQSGDLGGVVILFSERNSGQRASTTARVVKVAPPYGVGLRFESLGSAGQAPPGYRIRIDRIQADVGAFLIRKKKARRYVRRNGRKRLVRYSKKVRYDLVRNPKTCNGTWEYQVRVVYPAGRETSSAGTIPCTS